MKSSSPAHIHDVDEDNDDAKIHSEQLSLTRRRSWSSGSQSFDGKSTLPFGILLGIATVTAILVSLVVLLDKNGIATTSVPNEAWNRQRRLSSSKSRSNGGKIRFGSPYGPQKLSADVGNSRVLNVHIVPHTHDDVGWLKTIEQYYYGLNNTIQNVCVKNILDTVVASLLEHESRTFTYAETKFFQMWWNEQSDAVKDDVRYLVANKQFSFTNGGWCMHDEATTHFMGMIDQTTTGHEFLKRELGVIPKVGWQLDPFGHSASQASLMTHKMGFDALYFGRIDYQDLQLRQLERSCEGLWNASDNLEDTTVFWGLTGSYHAIYGPPTGFCFDEVLCSDPSLLAMNQSALVSSITDFLDELRVQADQSRGNHILITYGNDYNYQHASFNFANLDKLIQSINRFQALNFVDVPEIFYPRFDHVNIFFSSPEYYTKCKNDELHKQEQDKTSGHSDSNSEVHYDTKTDDFFPFSDRDHGFWAGYFTSRPSFKRHERVGSSTLLAARQIQTMPDVTGAPCDCDKVNSAIFELEDAVGVVQHHDGLSGTSKQHVTNDYSKRLQEGIDSVVKVTSEKLRRLFLGVNATEDLKDLTFCQRLNETVCDVSQAGTLKANTTDVYVIVYNALAQPRSTPILLPVSSAGSYQISLVGNSNGTDIVVPSIASLPSTVSGAASYVLPLDTGVIPPLGANIYQVTFLGDLSESQPSTGLDSTATTTKRRKVAEDDVVKADQEYSNGLVTVVFDGNNGTLKSIATASNFTLNVSHEWGYYTSWDYSLDGKYTSDQQNSGAYIFRPSTPNQKLTTIKPVSAKFQETGGFVEVQVEYEEPWIQTTYRILPGQPHLEVEYTVGPIPIDDGRGKEVVSRFSSCMQSMGTFYTDSNGREFIQRKVNYRPTWNLEVYEPVAGNYCPVNAAVYVEDESKKSALAVAVDRSQGGASLQDGSVELLVHRRTLVDDGRGVGEPMNETDGGVTPYPPYGNATRYGKGLVVRGKHRVLVGDNGGATLARSMMDSAFADPFVFVGSSATGSDVAVEASSISGMGKSFPPNVMLITRLRLTAATSSQPEKEFLIRLGHQYGMGEDEELSKPASIDLADCLPGYEISGVVEMTLSGNQNLEDWEKTRLMWSDSKSESSKDIRLQDGTVVELQPMDIRTFRVTVKS